MGMLLQLAVLLWFAQSWLFARAALVARAPATPAPVSVEPSQNWDGDDGPWSSFTLRVGTPEQNVRVFISSTNPDTWLVLPNGCPTTDSSCVESRGRTFNYNTSSTWSQHGFYELGTQQNLDISAQAVFGNDTLGLGIQGSGGPTLPDQIIGAYTSNDFYLGMFGLNPASTNFTPEDQGRLSYMTTLKNSNLIPSLSFGYTAGNQYRLKRVLGSLTLGGLDSSKFSPNNLTVPFASDPKRNLMVGIQSITSTDQSGAKNDLLPDGIMAFVDSTVPQIWLPTAACRAFEKAFGLIFDEKSELYLVNNSLHSDLQDQNASLTFTLGSVVAGGETIDLTLPYDSFDLLVTPPTPNVANNSRYFPLRRAANESQYTLGRTFLQEVYLAVDWERQNFSLSQCTFQDSMEPNIVPIKSVHSTSDSSSGGSSSGKTAGIAVGVVVGILAIVGAIVAFLFFRRRKYRQLKTDKKEERSPTPTEEVIRRGHDKGELGTGTDNQRYELLGSNPPPPKPEEPSEWVNEKQRLPGFPGHGAGMAEADGGDSVPEIGSSSQHRGPLKPLHEMYDPSAPAIELPGDAPRAGELQGSNPSSAAPSPGMFGLRSRSSNPGSPVSHSSSTHRRRSFRERFSTRPAASRSPTLDSLPSLNSSAGGGPLPPPKDEVLAGSGHSGEPFSPVSRQGAFTPDPISRQGTFTPDPVSRQGTFGIESAEGEREGAGGLRSPVSPSSPEANRGLFERIRGPGRQGR